MPQKVTLAVRAAEEVSGPHPPLTSCAAPFGYAQRSLRARPLSAMPVVKTPRIPAQMSRPRLGS
jgi:hypothetical protein